ncbi:unnamed protein product [Lactuca saligna]|uniref:MULE transposase domain-containing protein n=1 Tax=Lactuca saligna TaxID=75948 RepID=A0AA36E5G7_LACSI|nr:unnamed protein product [Lactuca saligna]
MESLKNTLYTTPRGLLRGCRTSISQAWTASGVMNLWKGIPDKGLTLISNKLDYAYFMAIAYECGVILPMYIDHFGNSNMQEWLDEHKEEVVDNIVEEVLDGAILVKEIASGHLDDEDENEFEDEDDHEDDDVDVDVDEDNHSSPHVFEKSNGSDVEMGENAALSGPLEEGMHYDEDVYPQLPNIFNEQLHWTEQEPVLGMRFESPKQLKFMLCNYAVANAYQLCFVKNDSRWLLAKCCDGNGELLCVVGRDANNGIFPIAWAVVCVENKENWEWFNENLAQDLQC